MNRYFALIARWLVWMLVVSLESVMGFPWISVFLAAEWILADKEMMVANVLFLATVLAAAYGITLTVGVGAALVLWHIHTYTRKNSLARLGALIVSAAVIGGIARVPLTQLTVGMAVFELLLLLRVSKGGLFRTSWQKIKPLLSSEI